jgi:hypothetical protein
VSVFLALAAGSFGCGGDGGGGGGGNTGTGGTSSMTGTGGVSPTAPEAGISDCAAKLIDADGVCRPSLAKCAAGTIPDVDQGCVPVGVPACAAMFVDARGLCLPDAAACAAGSYPVPSLGCVPIDGAGCGTGTWGDVIQAAGDVYVDPTYTASDADGSRAKPYGALPAAIAAAPAGARIVLAAGSYDGALELDHSLEIVGVCPSKVTLTAASTDTRVVTADPGAGGKVTLRRLTVDATCPGLGVRSGDALVEDVVLQHVSWKGIEISGASTTATVRRTLVTDTSNGGAEKIGIGAQANGGGTLTLEHSAVVRARTSGLQAVSGTVHASDVFVGDLLPDGGGNATLAAAVGGEMILEGSVLRGGKSGATVFKTGKLELHHGVVAGTTDTSYGSSVGVVDAASVAVVDGSALVDSANWGLNQYAGTLTSANNLIADITGGPYGGLGIGSFGKLTSSHDVVARTTGIAVQVTQGAQLEGLVVDGVARSADLRTSLGVSIGDPGVVTLKRSYVTGAEDYGVQLVSNSSGKPGGVELDRCLVEKITGRCGGTMLGVGIGGMGPLTVTLTGTRIQDVHGAGLVLTGASATITGSRVIGVTPSAVPATRFPAGGKTTPGIADGLVFHAGSASLGVTVSDTWFEGFARAGLTLSTGAHTLTGVHASGGQYGLALEDGATATQSGCDFTGNSQGDVVDPGTLATPPAP